MFKEIVIYGSRGLNNIKLKELERINVLIGENNSGKTSVLEAIQLFSSKNVIENGKFCVGITGFDAARSTGRGSLEVYKRTRK